MYFFFFENLISSSHQSQSFKMIDKWIQECEQKNVKPKPVAQPKKETKQEPVKRTDG